MTKLWSYVKDTGSIYLGALFVIYAAYVTTQTTDWVWITTVIVSYLTVVTFWYYSLYLPKWYCRWKWGCDKYPYHHPLKFKKFEWFYISVIWPILVLILATVFICCDFKIGYQKIKTVLR